MKVTKPPTDMLRLVLQLEDTEPNRAIFIKVVEAIKAVPFSAQNWSVLKVEQIRPTFYAKLETPTEKTKRAAMGEDKR